MKKKNSLPIGTWLSVKQLSEHLGVSKEVIYRWLENDFIPAYRVGKLWKFNRVEVDSWVKSGGASNENTR